MLGFVENSHTFCRLPVQSADEHLAITLLAWYLSRKRLAMDFIAQWQAHRRVKGLLVKLSSVGHCRQVAEASTLVKWRMVVGMSLLVRIKPISANVEEGNGSHFPPPLRRSTAAGDAGGQTNCMMPQERGC